MKKILKKFLKIIITFIISLLLLELIKNTTIAVEPSTVTINDLLKKDSSELSDYIGGWTKDGYKYFGILDFYRNTGVGYTYVNSGGYSVNVKDNDDNYAIAAYLANCSTKDALKKGWNSIFNSIKQLMSEDVAKEFKNISINGDVSKEIEEAKAYAAFCKQLKSGKSISANSTKVKIDGKNIGPITLTTLVKDTKKGEYKYTEGTKNTIKIELSIKGEGLRTLTYDVVSGKVSGSGIGISGNGANGIKNITAGKAFTINILNGKKNSYTKDDLVSLKIYDQYKLYSARVFLYGKLQGGTGRPDIKTGSPNSSRRNTVEEHGGGIGADSYETPDCVVFEGTDTPEGGGGGGDGPSSDPNSDFALRKAITSINGKPYSKRGLDYTSLGNLTNYEAGKNGNPVTSNAKTTANYEGKVKALPVKVGDKITYTIRVYNEWKEDKPCPAITDYFPEGLKITSKSKADGWVESGTKTIKGKTYYAYTKTPNQTIPKFEEYTDVKYYKKVTYYYKKQDGGEYKKIGRKYELWGPGQGDYTRVYTTEPNLVSEDKIPKNEINDKTKWKYAETKPDFIPRSSQKLKYIDVTIELEVDKTGGGDLYNYAEITGLKDRDSSPNNIISGEDDEDYDVVHKYVDIGGIIFVDGTLTKEQEAFKNGFFNSGEKLFNESVKVTLISNTGKSWSTTTTNGKYSFKDKDSDYSYKVKFEYNGVEYIATIDTSSSSSYTNNNDAKEDTGQRTALNGKFKEISYEFLSTNPSKTITANTGYHSGKESTDKLKCINLGLVKRTKADLSLMNDVYKTEIIVNGKTEEYTYGTIETAKQSIWYNEKETLDKTRYNQYICETDTNEKKTKDFEVYVTYKIVVTNESSTKAVLREIVDYFDKRFEFISATVNGKSINASSKSKYFNITNNTSKSNVNYNNADYKTIYISFDESNKIVLDNGNKCIIEVKLRLCEPSKTLSALFNEKKDLQARNYAEIKGFSTENNTVERAGVLDFDSEPGNYKIGGVSEDDNSKTPVVYFIKKAPRIIKGSVWEAISNNIKCGADINQNTALLQYIENNGIKGIKVELLELQNGKLVLRDNDYSKTTDEKGEYIITNYIPGDYVIRFTYGGDCKTTSKYTKYNYDGTEYAAMFNGQNYQSTKGNPNENVRDKDNHRYWYINETDKRYSDAHDDATMRYSQIQDLQNKGYSYAEVRKLFNQDDPNEYINTEMYAYTGIMELEVEPGKTKSTYNNNSIYEIKNIDFGLTPRTETIVAIDKYITHVKLTLADRTVHIDSDIKEIAEGKIKGIKTPGNRSDVTIELEDEIVQGAVLEITYEIKVENKSKEETLTLYKDVNKKIRGISYYNENIENLIPYEGKYKGDNVLFATNGKKDYQDTSIKGEYNGYIIKSGSEETRTNNIEIKQLVDHSELLYTDTKLEENKWKLDLDNAKLRLMDKEDKRLKAKDKIDVRKEATCVLLDDGQIIIKPNKEYKQKIITSTALSPRTAINIDPTYDNNALISILGSNTGRITDITILHTKSENTSLVDPLGKKGFSQIEFMAGGIIIAIFAIGVVLIKRYVLNKK